MDFNLRLGFNTTLALLHSGNSDDNGDGNDNGLFLLSLCISAYKACSGTIKFYFASVRYCAKAARQVSTEATELHDIYNQLIATYRLAFTALPYFSRLNHYPAHERLY